MMTEPSNLDPAIQHERELIEAAQQQELDTQTATTPDRPSDLRESPPAVGPRLVAGSRRKGAFDQGRFLPGTVLAGRYRIIGLLGKGGMGEVYRADDLKLGLPIAIKFLPERLEHNTSRLQRFLDEVRIARQVTHRNVCRVYDIGEANGQHFISMECVDGEDLASLLRKIGRFPEDKGIDVARQLCAGLAAAHERGILHRDLKPANIMLDTLGQVRITDFGLAGFADDIQGAEAAAGTPAYMAPEQLAGRAVTVQSDLYALGLILRQMFTGEPAVARDSRQEPTGSQRQAAATTPSTKTGIVDPVIERVIRRCLESVPAQRPASALVVAAALPGGDPLAEALAAGDTPLPAMVAAAGERGLISPRLVVTSLSLGLIGLVVVTLLAESVSLFGVVPLDKPVDSLAEKAKEIIRLAGYNEAPTDIARGFTVDVAYLRDIMRADRTTSRWNILASGERPAIRFWFRQAGTHLHASDPMGRVSETDPPALTRETMLVRLDPQGRLLTFQANPAQRDSPPQAAGDPDWPRLFERAGLEWPRFTNTAPQRVPPAFCDERWAWQHAVGVRPDQRIRVEAASLAGKPILFEVVGSVGQAEGTGPRGFASNNAYRKLMLGTTVAVLLVSALLARRNLRAGRGDRRGAGRLAWYYLMAYMLVWLFQSNHPTDPLWAWRNFVKAAGNALFWSGALWLNYIALEPSVRRRWPDRIISWNRLIAGGFRDPLVGRDVLVGGLFGVAWMLLDQIAALTPRWLGQPPPMPSIGSVGTLLSARHMATEALSVQLSSVSYAMGLFVLLLALHVLLRRSWPARLVCFALLTSLLSIFSMEGETVLVVTCFAGLQAVLLMIVVLRFGLLPLMVTFFVGYMLAWFPLTWDFSSWKIQGSLFALVTCTGVLVYGSFVGLAGRPLLQDELLHG